MSKPGLILVGAGGHARACIDVIEQQLAASTHVDEASRQQAIKNAKSIDEAAHHRIGQTKEINHE